MTKSRWRVLDVLVGLLTFGVSFRSSGLLSEGWGDQVEPWAIAAALSGVLLIFVPQAGALLVLLVFGFWGAHVLPGHPPGISDDQ